MFFHISGSKILKSRKLEITIYKETVSLNISGIRILKYLRIPNPENLEIRAFTLLRIFDPEI